MTTVSIMVKDVSCSFIPNIITPNGDDLNDWFTIPCLDGNAFTNNSLVVYNQWGDKVFEDKGYTNDPSDPVHPAWRGTLNGDGGKDLPDGVYFYIFTPAPSEKPLKGFVEIFR
jgi:gliding motility-associated-like protein